MDNMIVLKNVVHQVLTEDKRTRNSDSFLYLKVLEVYGKQHGLDIHNMSIVTFLLNMKVYGFPPFESVRRNRQLIQAKHQALCADDPIDAHRLVNEERMRNYVRGEKYTDEDEKQFFDTLRRSIKIPEKPDQ